LKYSARGNKDLLALTKVFVNKSWRNTCSRVYGFDWWMLQPAAHLLLQVS
jgi:hypothetical protein